MIEFKNRIVQLGFGAVGKSFFEKVPDEIKFDLNNYLVISKNKLEYTFFIELGGKVGNFIIANINRNNYNEIFNEYLSEGDFLIDFTDGVGTKDFVEWCANKNVFYLNTGETDWDDNWYSIFEEYSKKNILKEQFKTNNNLNKYPIVVHHGNNPGLVSHFVKLGIEYIVRNQFKNDIKLNELLKRKQFNLLAKELDLKQVHVNDNDLQIIKDTFYEDKLFSTWSIDSFFFEMLSNATANIGTNEVINRTEEYNLIDLNNGFLELKKMAIDQRAKTFYPNGKMTGYVVPHEETITISKSLEIKENNKAIYRPTVIFIYSPCEFAIRYLEKARIKNSIDISQIQKNKIVHGFKYPEKAEIVYKENIKDGTEYVGVLLLGSSFNPVWIGNRIKKRFLYKRKKKSFWQTPTITPVSMSALSAVCWMIKNKNKGGIYFPDDIEDYNEIINFSEKYISKTIYKTFNLKKIERELNIDLKSIQLKDILL